MKTLLRYFLGLVLALGFFAVTLTPARAFFGISVGIAPPPLPYYVQPACPGLGYIWTPGYWAWDQNVDQYYWVPGSWALAPEVGYLWTPCWWGWADGAYCYHPGYWGRDVGFYGGINYGFGYNGYGYGGGYWHGNHFFYNRSVNNVGGIAASRTFSRNVEANSSRASFNGNGGTTAVASAAEQRAAGEHHIGATRAQGRDARSAATDPSQRFSANHGSPQVTSTTRAGSFRGTGAATGGRTSGDSAFTGENRTASGSEHMDRTTGASASSEALNRTSGEDAFTGASHTASAEHAQAASEAEHRSQVASEERRAEENRSAEAERTASVERHASEQRVSESHIGESHYSAPTHVSSYHAESFHPSAPSHSGGGGGGSFAHASMAHAGGGGGGGHAPSGGGGGHPGGGAHH